MPEYKRKRGEQAWQPVNPWYQWFLENRFPWQPSGQPPSGLQELVGAINAPYRTRGIAQVTPLTRQIQAAGPRDWRTYRKAQGETANVAPSLDDLMAEFERRRMELELRELEQRGQRDWSEQVNRAALARYQAERWLTPEQQQTLADYEADLRSGLYAGWATRQAEDLMPPREASQLIAQQVSIEAMRMSQQARGQMIGEQQALSRPSQEQELLQLQRQRAQQYEQWRATLLNELTEPRDWIIRQQVQNARNPYLNTTTMTQSQLDEFEELSKEKSGLRGLAERGISPEEVERRRADILQRRAAMGMGGQLLPNAPEWLPEFVPGIEAGAPITAQWMPTPSGQQFARMSPTQTEMLAGYSQWQGVPWQDVLARTQSMLPQPRATPQWRPAKQRRSV